jgi:hypothetical protein
MTAEEEKSVSMSELFDKLSVGSGELDSVLCSAVEEPHSRRRDP